MLFFRSCFFPGFLLVLLAGRASADELDDFIAAALAGNPEVASAGNRIERTEAECDEVRAFFDPSLIGVGGWSEGVRSIPGSTGFTSTVDNALEFRGGVSLPVNPGINLSAGISERRLTRPGQDLGHLFQTIGGVGVEIPLVRDRGFALWDIDYAEALANYQKSRWHLVSVTQKVCHDVELVYILAYQGLAELSLAQEATARFAALLEQAEQLAELEVIPDFQVLPAKMELKLRREEQLSSEQALEDSLRRLAELLGTDDAPDLGSGTDNLVNRALEAELPAAVPDMSGAFSVHGSYREILLQIEIAELGLTRYLEDMKTDVSVQVGVTVQGEDAGILGTTRILSEDHVGAEAVVVWRRSFGRAGERARLAAQHAGLKELRERKRALELQLRTDMEIAAAIFDQASRRLELVDQATGFARETLKAEEERFRLGEGRSRYVLDAQKDLTNIERRQTRVAARLLRAYADFHFATGYAFGRQRGDLP